MDTEKDSIISIMMAVKDRITRYLCVKGGQWVGKPTNIRENLGKI
jgi:hypothetical protein